jgi:hypothetical protein
VTRRPLETGQSRLNLTDDWRLNRVAERCSTLATAFSTLTPNRLRVVPGTKGGLERETGLEPAMFSLEGLSVYALWHPSWNPEHFVSSYRVFVWS